MNASNQIWANNSAQYPVSKLKTTTHSVNVTSPPPVLGQALIATSPLSAQWSSITNINNPIFYIYGIPGGTPTGTRFLYPGTHTVTVNEPKLKMTQSIILNKISVNTRIAPGGARVDTYTVRNNGVDTALSVSLTGAQLDNQTTAPTVFNINDELSLKLVTDVASGQTDPIIIVEGI